MTKDITEHRVLAFVFGLWVLAAICLQTYGVFARNVLADSTTWVDDLQRLNFVWLIWICGAFAYGGRGLVALDLVISRFSSRPRIYHGYTLVLTGFEFFFGAIFSWLSIQVLMTHLRSGETTVGIGMPLALITLGFMVGCLLILLFAIRKLIVTVRRFTAAEPVESETLEDVLAKGD